MRHIQVHGRDADKARIIKVPLPDSGRPVEKRAGNNGQASLELFWLVLIGDRWAYRCELDEHARRNA